MKTYQTLTLNEFRKQLKKCNGKTVVLDTETTGLWWWCDHLVTVGFHSLEANVEGAFDFGKPVEEGHEEDEDLLAWEAEARAVVAECLQPGTTVIMHNYKFDASFLGVQKESDMNGWKPIDTAVMIHLWDSRLKKGLELAERTLLGSNSKRAHIEKAPTNPKIRKKIWRWESHIRSDYCLNDTRVTMQLYQTLLPMLKKMDLEILFKKEMKYLKQIFFTEHLGITLDQEFVGKALLTMTEHKMKLEENLYDSVGYRFNWQSNMQLSKALYEDMGIEKPVNPFAARGDTGGYKNRLGIERIKELKGGMYNKTMTSTFLLMEKVKHPLGELVASLREASKLVKTMQLWLRLVDKDSIIHSNFNLTGTRTGRLSSSKPNLANVASEVRSRFTQGLYSGGLTRSSEYNLRNAFVAREGYGMLSIDFQQQEMRLFAWESQDERMLEAVKTGQDIHLMIALAVWGDCGKELNKIHREWSKTVGFGLLYGMTTGSLEHKLGLTRDEAAKVISDYWGRFPNIRPYLFGLVEDCKQQGYVRNWAGRLWREETEMFMYKSCNFMVQGGSADLLSIAAMRSNKYLQEKKVGNIVSYIYDELLMEIKLEHMKETANAIASIMQVPDLLKIDFLTDVKVGTTYGNLVGWNKNEEGIWCPPIEEMENS
jgi:DNA polymerase-1